MGVCRLRTAAMWCRVWGDGCGAGVGSPFGAAPAARSARIESGAGSPHSHKRPCRLDGSPMPPVGRPWECGGPTPLWTAAERLGAIPCQAHREPLVGSCCLPPGEEQ